MIPNGDRLGESHPLNDMSQTIDEVDLIGSQKAIGFDRMTCKLMNLQKKLAHRNESSSERCVREIEGATRQVQLQASIAAPKDERGAAGGNGSTLDGRRLRARLHHRTMQDKRVVQQVGLITHGGWLSRRQRLAGLCARLRSERGSFAAGTHKGAMRRLTLVALLQKLLKGIVPRCAHGGSRPSERTEREKRPVEQ